MKFKKGLAGLGVAAILGVGLITGVSADDTPTTKSNDVNLEIIGSSIGTGGLALETSNIVDFDTVELTAEPATYNTGFEGNFTVTDLRGTQEGYDLSVTATPFDNGSHTLPEGSLTLNPIASIDRVDSGSGDMPSFITASTSTIDDGAVTVLSAIPGEGAGIFDITFSEDALGLTVDATTAKVGTYTSTLTWDLTSAPSGD